MQIIINTDHNADATDDAVTSAEGDIRTGLDRFARELTRVEVHLRDESAGRDTGSDKRCMIEARPAGLDPVAVSFSAGTYAEAVSGATARLVSRLSSILDKRHDQSSRETIRRP